MAQQTRAGTIFANDATVGTIDWTSPGNAQTSDDQWASVALGKGVISHYLKITGFGFTIPNAAINWVKVTYERHANNVLVYDYSVKLVKGGTIQGIDKATTTRWPASDASEAHGGTDKWGLTLLYTDVNAENFGCVVSAKNYKTGSGATYTGYIDYIEITIDYTIAPTQKSLSVQTVNVLSIQKSKTGGIPLYEYYNIDDDVNYGVYGLTWKAQSFYSFTSHIVKSVKLKLSKGGNPGLITVSIKAVNASGYPTGADLCSGTLDGNSLTSTATWREITFGDGVYLSPVVKYAIVVRAPNGDASNLVYWRADNTAPAYGRGTLITSADGGSSWTPLTADGMFEEYGIPDTIVLTAHIIDGINWAYPSPTCEPQFLKDSYGTLHCVYQAYYDIMHAWSDDEGITWNTEVIYTEGRLYPNPTLAIGSDDALYVVWQVMGAAYNYARFSKKPHGGSWTAPIYVVPGTSSDEMGNGYGMLIDNSDNLYYFYDRQKPNDIYHYQEIIRIYNGSSWGSPEIILDMLTALSTPKSLFDTSWQIHYFYTEANRVKETIRSGGSWSSPVIVYDTGHTQGATFAFIVGTTIYLFWNETIGVGNYWISYTYNSGSGWNTPVLIGEQNYTLSYVKVILNGSFFEIVYLGKKDSGVTYNALYYFQFDGASSTPVKKAVENLTIQLRSGFLLTTGLGTCFSYSPMGAVISYCFAEIVYTSAGGQQFQKALYVLMEDLLHFAKCKPKKRCMSFNQFQRNSRRVN